MNAECGRKSQSTFLGSSYGRDEYLQQFLCFRLKFGYASRWDDFARDNQFHPVHGFI
jgi:hypothetical protein